MAKLKAYSDGSGHFIQGPAFAGANISTWSHIPKDALDLLKRRGIRVGQRVPPDLMHELIDRGLIWTGGGGPGPPTDVIEEDIKVSESLIQSLLRWARSDGSEEGLEVLLTQSREINIYECFKLSFLKFLVKKARDAPLSALREIFQADFRSLIRASTTTDLPKIHETLLDHDGGDVILWRFAKIIGEVSIFAEHEEKSPTAWENNIRKTIFDEIKKLLSEEPKKKKRRQRFRYLEPYIVWQTHEQVIVAVLPSQKVPSGTQVQLRVAGEKPVSQVTQNDFLDELVSPPLDPSPEWNLSVRYLQEEQTKEEKIRLPSRSYVFFSPEGKMIVDETNLSPGEYLLLSEEELDRDDVEIIEELMEPIGWYDYFGYRVDVSEATHIGSYQFASDTSEINWKLEELSEQDIKFAHNVPVWIDDCPGLYINTSRSELLEEAKLEVEVTSGKDEWLQLNNLPSQDTNDGISFSIEQLFRDKDIYGHVRLRLHLPRLTQKEIESLEFIRLPEMSIKYMEDSRYRKWSLCVEIEAKRVGLDSYEGTEILPDSSDNRHWTVRPENPFKSPEVYFGLTLDQRSRYIPVRIRVPVTRVALIGRTEKFGKYQAPPIDIDLSEIKYDSKLRVQFHLPPLLKDEELQCKIIWGEPFAIGDSSSQFKNTYDIPLHRWRDRFGKNTFGTVQVLTPDGWIEIAELVSQTTEAQAPEEPCLPDARWQNLIRDLYDTQNVGEQEILVHKCFEYASADDCPPHVSQQLVSAAIESLLHFGKYDEAEETLAHFQQFADLPDFRLLRTKIDLRTEQDGFELNRIDNRVKNMTNIPQKDLLLAEVSYRLARTKGAMNNYLKSSYRSIIKHRPLTIIEKVEARMLDAIVSFHLNKRQHEEMASENSDVKYVIEVLKKVEQYLNTSRNSWKSEYISWDTNNHLLKFWHPDDVTFVSLCVAQATEEIEKARNFLDTLLDSDLEFRGLELLKARQYYLEDKEKAKEIYFDIIDEYPFVIGEISQCYEE